MEKYELPCGIVEDLLPSYVDGLTGQEEQCSGAEASGRVSSVPGKV